MLIQGGNSEFYFTRALKMEQNKKSKFLLFTSMVKIGCLGFGGGNALIPLMHQELVEKNKVVNSEEFEEDVVVASITPGALPVEIAGGVGSRIGSWLGMLLGSVGMALPGLLLTLLLLVFLSGLNEDVVRQIGFLTVGISAFIVCLLMDYVVKTINQASQSQSVKVTAIVIFAVFCLTCEKTLYRILEINMTPFFGIATIHVFMLAFFLVFYLYNKKKFVHYIVSIILCSIYVFCVGKSKIIVNQDYFYAVATLMLVLSVYDGITNNISHISLFQKSNANETKKELFALVACVILSAIPAMLITNQTLMYLSNGMFSSLISFGGGDAYLTVADGLFVDTALITEDEFYGVIVPIVNLLPGSILCKTLSAIGYYIGYHNANMISEALLVALSGFCVSIAASCGVFAVIKYLYENLQQLEIFQIIRKIIRPIVSGLLLTVILSLIYQSRKMGIAQDMGWYSVIIMIGLSAINCWLYFIKKASNIIILTISIVMSMALCNFLVNV